MEENTIVQQTSNSTLPPFAKDFEQVYELITVHKMRTLTTLHNESMLMVWQVGGYVSNRLKTAVWGDGVVRMLSEYIRTRNPKVKGWSYRTIYKMVQFYETYSTSEFNQLVKSYGMQEYILPKTDVDGQHIVPFETAQLHETIFVPFEMAQIPTVLFATGWTNHQIILNRCKSDKQRLFYMLYAGHEQLENKELIRAFKTDAMTAILGAKDVQSTAMQTSYPKAGLLFKDTVYLDMFGLSGNYKESKLRKSIIQHMKDFILEMGKDFLFIDDEHRVTVGGKTFKVDLLFYHRLLQCMVAIELKTTEFHPKDLGQLEFYLEALDQEERRSNENPSIGIILCKEADMEVVRYALNRSMSPTMVAQYKEQLQVGGVIQRSLVEFCQFLSEGGKKEYKK